MLMSQNKEATFKASWHIFSDHSSSKIRERTFSSQLLEESQQFKDKIGVVECTCDAEVNIKKRKRVNR